jgi:hypothetical protein
MTTMSSMRCPGCNAGVPYPHESPGQWIKRMNKGQQMKITAKFHDRAPIELDGAWHLEIEIKGTQYEIVPQMVDKGKVANVLLRAQHLGAELQITPHASNAIVFGSKLGSQR